MISDYLQVSARVSEDPKIRQGRKLMFPKRAKGEEMSPDKGCGVEVHSLGSEDSFLFEFLVQGLG